MRIHLPLTIDHGLSVWLDFIFLSHRRMMLPFPSIETVSHQDAGETDMFKLCLVCILWFYMLNHCRHGGFLV